MNSRVSQKASFVKSTPSSGTKALKARGLASMFSGILKMTITNGGHHSNHYPWQQRKGPTAQSWGGSFQPPLVLCFQGQLWSVSQEMWLQKSQCLSYKHRIQETPSDLKQIDEAMLWGSTSSCEPSPQATVPSVCSAKFRLTGFHTVLLYKGAGFSIITELVAFL